MLHLQFTVGVVCSRSLLIVVNLFELIRINSGFVGNIASQPFFFIFLFNYYFTSPFSFSFFLSLFFSLSSLSPSLSRSPFLSLSHSLILTLSLSLSFNPVSFNSLFPRKFKSRSARLDHKHCHRRHHYYYDTISFFFRRELNTSACFFSLRSIFFFSFYLCTDFFV